MNRKELYGLFAVLAVVAAGLALQSVMSHDTSSSFRVLPGRAALGSGGATTVQVSRPGPGRAGGVATGPAGPRATGKKTAGEGGASADSSGGSSAFGVDGRLDLNRATAGDLQSIDRVGPARARAIVAYRERAGRFRDLHELEDVPGIGEKTRLAMEPFLFVEGDAGASAGTAPLAEAASASTSVATVPLSGRSSSGAPPAAADFTPAIGIEPAGASAALTSAPLQVAGPLAAPTATPAAPVPAGAAGPVVVAPSLPPVLAAPGQTPPSTARARSAKATVAPQVVNINTAGETELAALWNVGPVKAKAIVQWRQVHGAFRRPEDLDQVPGIGPETVRRNLPMITVGP